MIKGSVDAIDAAAVHGWAYAPDRSGPVLVQAVLNHEILGEAMATLYRQDLAVAGFGTGHCGFTIKLTRPLNPLYLPFVTVKLAGGDAELPRAGAFGLGTFFSAVGAAYPAAGRGRSTLGGLWTGRTDAAALLRGKLAIGQIATSLQAPLRRLIADGMTMVALPQAASASAWRASPPGQLNTLLAVPELAALLRAVLEDNVAVRATEWLDGEIGFTQPSRRNPTKAPAECLEVVLGFGDATVLELVRDSHELPEFTATGASRFGSAGAEAEAAAAAAPHAVVDGYALPAMAAAIVGAGTLYRLAPGGQGLRLLLGPARHGET